jgi:hypothetical protein
MNNKALFYILLITATAFFTNNASAQFIYKKPAVKKITKKEYRKLIADKQKKDRQNRNRTFVYRYI